MTYINAYIVEGWLEPSRNGSDPMVLADDGCLYFGTVPHAFKSRLRARAALIRSRKVRAKEFGKDDLRGVVRRIEVEK